MAKKYESPVGTNTGREKITRRSGTGQFTSKNEASHGIKISTKGPASFYHQGSAKSDAVVRKGTAVHLEVETKKFKKLTRSDSMITNLVTNLDMSSFEGFVRDIEARENFAAAPDPATYRDHDEATAEMLRDDPELATAMLDSIFEEGDQGELLVTLRQIAMAKGMAKIAEQTDLNRSQLYRTLSEKGNPSLNNLIAILKAMGMRLAVQPIESAS